MSQYINYIQIYLFIFIYYIHLYIFIKNKKYIYKIWSVLLLLYKSHLFVWPVFSEDNFTFIPTVLRFLLSFDYTNTENGLFFNWSPVTRVASYLKELKY